jgi:hypothetical protein
MPSFGEMRSGPEITALYRMSDAIFYFLDRQRGFGLSVNPKTVSTGINARLVARIKHNAQFWMTSIRRSRKS